MLTCEFSNEAMKNHSTETQEVFRICNNDKQEVFFSCMVNDEIPVQYLRVIQSVKITFKKIIYTLIIVKD